MIRSLDRSIGNNRIWQMGLSLLVGIAFGVLVIVMAEENLSTRIMASLVAAVGGVVVALISKDVKRSLLLLVFVDYATEIDFSIGYNTGTMATAGGFSISLTVLALGLLYVVWILEQRLKPATIWLGRPGLLLLAFIWTSILSMVSAPRVDLAINQLWNFFIAFLLFFYLIHHLKTESNLLFVVYAIAFGMAVQVAVIELQIFGVLSTRYAGTDITRCYGTLVSPNKAGGYLVQVIPVLVAGLFINKLTAWKKGMLLILIVAGLHALVIGTQSRGAWSATLVALVLITMIAIWQGWFTARALAVTLILICVLVPFFFGAVVARLTADDHGAAAARGPLNAIAFNVIQAHPIIGAGINNYGIVFYDYIGPEQYGAWLYAVHNTWLLVWSETGTVGMLFYVLPWLVVLQQGLRLIRQGQQTYSVLTMGFMVSLVSAADAMMADGYFLDRQMIMIAWTNMALIIATARISGLVTQPHASRPLALMDPH